MARAVDSIMIHPGAGDLNGISLSEVALFLLLLVYDLVATLGNVLP